MAGCVLLADAGYDSERDDRSSRNHAFCRERLGVRALIPARTRRYVAISRTPYRGEMARVLGCARLGEAGDPEARRLYRQRWKVEGVAHDP